MNVLFVFCEGPHDAQFIGRLMQESKQYKSYDEKLKDYIQPLGPFFSRKFLSKSVDELRIGKPHFPLVPICAYETQDKKTLIFPISIGGMDKFTQAIDLIKEIENSFSTDVLETSGSAIKDFSILFIYDADSRGVDDTVRLFEERFKSHYDRISGLTNSTWMKQRNHTLSVFVFTDTLGETGVLEDLLLELFRNTNEILVRETEKHFSTYFPQPAANADEIAHNAKRKKGVLASCGQMETGNAGAALTVVVRDTNLLNGAFNFSDASTQWSRLLKHIDQAFI
ncbi:hypothetical protein AAKU61_000008 [Undibacterium sp. GrIS 1.2]|uniref:hypothetical protein n=1 Tax=Undibacterium sp. GrIS 1.2 TaxID=3143933 RepID=UPI0033942417